MVAKNTLFKLYGTAPDAEVQGAWRPNNFLSSSPTVLLCWAGWPDQNFLGRLFVSLIWVLVRSSPCFLSGSAGVTNHF